MFEGCPKKRHSQRRFVQLVERLYSLLLQTGSSHSFDFHLSRAIKQVLSKKIYEWRV